LDGKSNVKLQSVKWHANTFYLYNHLKPCSHTI
jgi:hypothetical protein